MMTDIRNKEKKCCYHRIQPKQGPPTVFLAKVNETSTISTAQGSD